MTDEKYKEKLEAFKNSCRVYKKEKKMLEAAESDRNAFGNEKLYIYLREDIGYVEDLFEKIGRKCGANARLMIWLMFVEENIQSDIALQFGLTRRQLQYSLNKWMHHVFEEEDSM